MKQDVRRRALVAAVVTSDEPELVLDSSAVSGIHARASLGMAEDAEPQEFELDFADSDSAPTIAVQVYAQQLAKDSVHYLDGGVDDDVATLVPVPPPALPFPLSRRRQLRPAVRVSFMVRVQRLLRILKSHLLLGGRP